MTDNTTLNSGSGGDIIRDLARTTGASAGSKTQVVALDLGGANTNAEVLITAGQQLRAGSVPVAIASNQTALPISETGGAAITGAAMPTGGVGLTGWLSAIWKAVTGTLSVSVTALPALPAGTSAIGTVLVPETTFYNETTTALGASASFTGTTRDSGVAAGTATAVTYFNAYFFADQTGTAYIDCSNDASTWRPIATVALTASTGAILTAPVMTRYHRARLVNGTTAQTVCMVNSSYTGA